MIFISILTLIVAKALPSLNSKISSVGFTRISAIIFIFSGALTLNALYIQSIGSGIGIYSGLFHITQISQSIEFFLLVIGSLILIAWPLVSYKENKHSKTEISNLYVLENDTLIGARKGINTSTDYSLVVLFSTLGSCLLISCSDLISLYLSIELQSFGLYILATLYRDSESSTSAGLKYFLLGGLSSCIILLGCGLIYSYTGLTNLESIYSLISVSEINYLLQGFNLGLILIIIGFLFKIAAAPLHNWSPDVYDDTPTIVTIWLTIMPKIAILILLLELHLQIGLISTVQNNISDITLNNITSYININTLNKITPLNILNSDNTLYILKNLLLISSVLSLIIGSVVGLAQTRIKRLLAYSTISHIGFMLLALSINTEQSINSFLFYIIQYTITNLNIFLIIIALSYLISSNSNQSQNLIENKNDNSESLNNKILEGIKYASFNVKGLTDIRYISELKGQFFSNPILSISLAICLFSMAGIPPLIGFFSKQYVLNSAMQNGYYFISILAIILSIVSASYYLKIITVLHTETETSNIISVNGDIANSDNNNNNLLENKDKTLTNFHSFLISTLTLIILLFILKPSLILNSTLLLSLSIFTS
uniref:NADH dehydrogenase subunit 2 n=1 Tax=Floccularia luteovirens TaxID=493452 RepID=UPI003000FC27|nr:NADH dehydrogenase subunit 2 [Floccularia luteovirens]